jgi:hypothetical protein
MTHRLIEQTPATEFTNPMDKPLLLIVDDSKM